MPKKRKRNNAVERVGVNYVRTIVESHNCIFQEIDKKNDLGNDGYIEFISEEESTSFFVWVQIKSGKSYKKKRDYTFQSNKDDFEYWRDNIAPVVGIVYDRDVNSAVWINITDYLRNNQSIIANGPYAVHIPVECEFNDKTFPKFKEYFIEYVQDYKNTENFGRSLEYFSMIDNDPRCLDGLKSLFINHRNRSATWYYFINCFRNIESPFILGQLVTIISFLPGHPDIFWHKDNIIKPEIEKYGKSVIRKTFGYTEVVKLLNMVDEWGFTRGSIGYTISVIINLINNNEKILKHIAFNDEYNEELRGRALFVFLYFEQFNSPKHCIDTILEYRKKYPDTEDDDLFSQLSTTLEKEGFLGYIGHY